MSRSRNQSKKSNTNNVKNSKLQYQNYLTVSNGCRVVFKLPKPLPHLNPQNILTQNIRQVWLSHQLPATCIIDMRNMIQKPVYFNRVGFRCWHQYSSNPKLIEIEYSNQREIQNSGVWSMLSKIRLQLREGWQHFRIPLLMGRNLSFIRISIVKNYSQQQDGGGGRVRKNSSGDCFVLNEDNSKDDQYDSNDNNNLSSYDKKRNYHHIDNNNHHVGQQQWSIEQSSTYLNQISLGCVEEIIQSRVQLALSTCNKNSTNQNNNNFPISNYRQKTFSDFRKSTLPQKQFKKLKQKLKQLTTQNIIIKRTIEQQNNVILRMQKAIDLLVQTVTKMQKAQSIQQQKILNPTKHNRQITYYKINNHHHNHKSLKDTQQKYSSQSSSYYTKQKSNEKFQKKKSSNKRSLRNYSNNSQSSKNNSYKQNKGKVSVEKRKNSNKKKLVINADIDQSDNILSQYEGLAGYHNQLNQSIKVKQSKQKILFNKQIGQSKQKSYIPMLEKLQQLIMLRDRKKHRMRTNEKLNYSNKKQIQRIDNVGKNDKSYDDYDYEQQ